MKESEQEIQGVNLLSSRCTVGPAMKRPDCRVRAVSSRKSLLAVG
jgi:hypothetical protein